MHMSRKVYKLFALLSLSVLISQLTLNDLYAKTDENDKQIKNEASNSKLQLNKKIAQDYFSQLIEKEDINYVDKLFAQNAHVQFGPSWKSTISGHNKISGSSDLKKHFAHIHSKKDVKSETKEIVAEGDNVAIYRITHETLANGSKAEIPWMSFFKIKNGKIISVHHVHDSLAQEQQHKKQ